MAQKRGTRKNWGLVCLDQDGTILNSRDLARRSISQILVDNGRPPLTAPEHREAQYDLMRFLRIKGIMWSRAEVDRRRRRFLLKHWNEADFFHDVPRFLRVCRVIGIPVGIVSGELEDLIERRLQERSIRNFFDFIRGDVRDKQAALETQLSRMSVKFGIKIPPKRACYIDDTTEGISAAVRAGMFAIGITHGGRGWHSAEKLRKAGADRVVGTLMQAAGVLFGEKRIKRALRERNIQQ